ncbi:hypothetical protein PT273_00880 [Orbaceae bacterium ESL0727]|nr:hypothetical protein [Orbaceae bacterium ESL0727]
MSSKTNSRYNLIKIVFIVFFTLYSIKTGIISLSITDVEIIFLKNLLNIILTIISFLSIFYIKEKKYIILYILFIFLCFYAIFFLDNNAYSSYILTISLLILSSRINWNDLIKYLFFSSYLSFIFIFLMLIFSNHYSTLDDRFGMRFTAGFNNPNSFAQYLLTLLSISILYFENQIHNKIRLFILSSTLFFIIITIISFTLSRTALILSIFYYILFIISLFSSFKQIYRKKLVICIIIVAISIMIFQIYSTILFNSNDILIFLNLSLSGRVWLANLMYVAEGLPHLLLGINITDYLPMDFYFIANIYSLGIFPFFIFCFITIKKLFKTRLSLLMGYTLLIMVLETISETYLSVPFYSVALFIIFHADAHQNIIENLNSK